MMQKNALSSSPQQDLDRAELRIATTVRGSSTATATSATAASDMDNRCLASSSRATATPTSSEEASESSGIHVHVHVPSNNNNMNRIKEEDDDLGGNSATNSFINGFQHTLDGSSTSLQSLDVLSTTGAGASITSKPSSSVDVLAIMQQQRSVRTDSTTVISNDVSISNRNRSITGSSAESMSYYEGPRAADGGSSSTTSATASSRKHVPNTKLATQPLKQMASAKMIEFSHERLQFSRTSNTFVGREKEQRILDNAVSHLFKRPRSIDATSASSTNNEELVVPASQNITGNTTAAPTTTFVDSTSTEGGAIKSFVTISGLSGTGKSALSTTYLQHKCKTAPALFVTGKFDFQQNEEPYSGMRMALIDLCFQIASNSELCQELSERLENAELSALSKLIPNIVDVVGTDRFISADSNAVLQQGNDAEQSDVSESQHNNHEKTTNKGYKEQSDRLKFALLDFMGIICKHFPVILVCDDIQWADQASMDLITSWMRDPTISALMIVCSYRSNTDRIAKSIQAVEDCKRERAIRVISMHIENLTVEHVNQLLLIWLLWDENANPDITRGLAEIVHRRTSGNIFFVQQFLRALIQQELLSYHIGSMQWVWNEDDIQSQMPATLNVVELMKTKLLQIPAIQCVLPLAACIGSFFSARLVRMVLFGFVNDSGHRSFFEDLYGRSPPVDECDEILALCQKEGLLEVNATSGAEDDTIYRFVHDRVQEAALSLIPEDRINETQFRIGSNLLNTLSEAELDQYLFMVLNLMNAKLDMLPTDDQERRSQVAMLNHGAGQKAVSCSAFGPAHAYFQKALDLLPPDHWDNNYAMSLDLYSSLTECAFITSNTEQSREHGEQVIARHCPMLDKIRVYHVLMDIDLGNVTNDRTTDATRVGLNVLAKFKCKFPKGSVSRTVSLLCGLLKYKSAAAKWNESMLDSLPLADSKECAISKTLDKLVMAAYLTEPALMPLLVVRGVDRAFVHGIASYSPPSFLLLGLLMGFVLGEFETGSKCARLALAMLKRLDSRESESRTTFMCHGSVLNWTIPFRDCTPQMVKAHSIGMATGDVESGCWAMYYHLDMCYYGGSSLHSLDTDFSTYTKMASDFQQTKNKECMELFWQLVMNLRGISRERTLLVGDAVDERPLLAKYKESKDLYMEMYVKRNKTFAAVVFGEFQIAADLALEMYQILMANHAGQAGCMYMTFCAGLSCYAVSRKRDRSTAKYRKLAKVCLNKLKTWVGKANPNCVHYLTMVQGEREASRGSMMKADKHYREAIRAAGRRGLVQDQALANERLAERWIEHNDRDAAKFHFDKALELYREWGADHKVEILEARCGDLWQPPTEIQVG